MKCNACGAQLRGNERFCPYCGNEYERPRQDVFYTQNVANDQDQQFQPQQIHIHNHYQSQPERVVERVYVEKTYRAQPQVSSRSRLLMLLLCFVLGPLGVHHFYAGRIGRGILYLLTGGLCYIGSFIDLLVILFGNPKDRDGLPMRW